MKHTLGLVIEFSDLAAGGFVNDVVPQIIQDLESAKKNLRGQTSKVVHVILDVSEVTKVAGGFGNKVVAMLPVELGKIIRAAGWDTIYYGVDSSGDHWTTKEANWFNGSNEQRFRANEIITAEATIIVSGVDVETDRYRDIVYWIKKRKLMLRSVKPGMATWYMPENEKDWAKLRGKQGNLNLALEIAVAESASGGGDSSDAFDTGNEKKSAVMSRPEPAHMIGYATSTDCGKDRAFLDFSIAVCSVCHLLVELRRLLSGEFSINSEKFLAENISVWAGKADEASSRREFCLAVDMKELVADVNLPANLSTCLSKECAGLCEAVGTLSSALMYYGNMGVANTRVAQ